MQYAALCKICGTFISSASELSRANKSKLAYIFLMSLGDRASSSEKMVLQIDVSINSLHEFNEQKREIRDGCKLRQKINML